MKIKKVLLDNRIEAKLIELTNKNNVSVTLLNYGATIVSIKTPDKHNNIEEISLGYKNLDDYLRNGGYFGSTIGRTSGRIGSGKFRLNDKEYILNNEGKTSLHGGKDGFSNKVFDVSIDEDNNIVTMTYLSQHSESGYPGNLKFKVNFTLTDNNELIMDYYGISDEDTILNVTNHNYFNLCGNFKDNILNHHLQFKSDYYLEVDKSTIPTGNMLPVKGTPYDFNDKKLVGKDIQEVKVKNGYDDTWILKDNTIYLTEENSGRKLIVETTYPASVIYTCNYSNNAVLLNGVEVKQHYGICFECQYEPNGVNVEGFNSAILRKDKEYKHQIKYIFDVVE